MKVSIGKKIALGFVLAFIALLTISAVSFRNITELNADVRMVTHTMEVLQRLQNLYAGLLEAQGSARAYEFLSEESFRDAFNTARVKLNRELQTLRVLTQDNPSQQDRLDKLEPMISARLETSRKLMDSRRSDGLAKETPATTVMVQQGQKQTDAIRELIAVTQEEEHRLLRERQSRSKHTAQFTISTIIYGTLLALLLVAGTGSLITTSITAPLRVLQDGATRIGKGEYAHRVAVRSSDEVGYLASVFNEMAIQIQERQLSLAEQDWLKTSLTAFSAVFHGQRDLSVVCTRVLEQLASLLGARHSVLYVADDTSEKPRLNLCASYASDEPKAHLEPGEGLVGQCFIEKKQIHLHDIPGDYVKISSILGSARPVSLVVQPALFEGSVKAVLELASFQRFTGIQLIFLNQLADSIGIVLNTIEGGMRTEELLRQSESLSENLQEQTERLRESERELQQQQEELQQSNEELEQTNDELQGSNEEIQEKMTLLAAQKTEIERANQETENARAALEEKARQLSQTSQYKSEFLASMSHELRTPLNSLLILSNMLAENSEKNLSEKQVQYAKTIHSSGNDLLELINDILDLAKIESGTVELEWGEMQLGALSQFVEDTFRHVAESKKVAFRIYLDRQLPLTINSDARRLQQVIKNLLSNAFKFTERGSVEFNVSMAAAGWDKRCVTLSRASNVIALAVKDTGIGIPKEKQQLIFEAFQQADAGTARKYGGTGLGLSISREIARLLGGSLQVESLPGEGSTFTLYLPLQISPQHIEELSKRRSEAVRVGWAAPSIDKTGDVPLSEMAQIAGEEMEDDRANLQAGDSVLLIIEDDRNFASVLMEFAREKKFKAVVARTAAQGIDLAIQIKPGAIILDILLPDNHGWMVLDWLKHDSRTRHVPVHIVSVEEERERSLRLGAVSFLQKPVTKERLQNALSETIEFINRRVKKLLIIEDDETQRKNLIELIGNGDVITTAVGTAKAALGALEASQFDCVVLDLGLPDVHGMELIEEMQKKYGHRAPPIIVYTAKDLTRSEEIRLRRVSESIIVKDARSPERLLDETALFLHRVQSKLPDSKRRMIEQVHKSDSVLAGRKVLVVDDDVRNIFAITSALESYKMEVCYAETGQGALKVLEENPKVEVILMDVMMPDMDGFEAIRCIRQIEQFKKIPIISVTAKAMKGDREKCLRAGASDYITKPVDMDQLRSLLRVWLYR